MIIASSVAALVMFPAVAQEKTYDISRKFTVGESLTYTTKTEFTEEQRSGELQTMLPNDEEIGYTHKFVVTKMKADGIAQGVYTRPTMTIVLGDTNLSAAKTMVLPVNYKFEMDVSPINQILTMKDLVPPKPTKPGNIVRLRSLRQTNGDNYAAGMLFQYVQELEQLAFFVGPVNSGLDFAPKTPFDEVKIGETWKETVSYTPQKLIGGNGKIGVQRLDYTYTYLGIKPSKSGKDVHKVIAGVKLDTNMVEYAQQLTGGKNSASVIKSAPLKFEAKIEFDLDLATRHTILAKAETTGGYEIILKNREQPISELKFKGRTTVKLDNWVKGGAAKSSTEARTPKKKGGSRD
jgi:hypothetical protein